MSIPRNFILAVILFSVSYCRAQPSRCPKLPEKYSWKNTREYKRDEDLVLKILQWLNTTPMNADPINRGKANLFAMEWICGTNRFKIEINSDQLPFYANYPDLLFSYIFGIAQCKLSKNDDCDEHKAIISGYNAVAYQIGAIHGLKKSKVLKPIYKAYKRDKMDHYVESLTTKTKVK